MPVVSKGDYPGLDIRRLARDTNALQTPKAEPARGPGRDETGNRNFGQRKGPETSPNAADQGCDPTAITTAPSSTFGFGCPSKKWPPVINAFCIPKAWGGDFSTFKSIIHAPARSHPTTCLSSPSGSVTSKPAFSKIAFIRAAYGLASVPSKKLAITCTTPFGVWRNIDKITASCASEIARGFSCSSIFKRAARSRSRLPCSVRFPFRNSSVLSSDDAARSCSLAILSSKSWSRTRVPQKRNPTPNVVSSAPATEARHPHA